MSDVSLRLAQILPLIQERLAEGESVQFTPNGTSMRPMLYGGRDQVILSPLPEKLKKYDLPLYRRPDGQFVLHRVVEVGETYTCIGDNQYALEKGVPHEWMIALATGFVRKGKAYSVDCWRYKFYCRWWHWTRPLRKFGIWSKNILRAIVRRLKRIFAKQEG